MKQMSKTRLAILCFVVALAAYWGLAAGLGKAHTSPAAYFNILAEAFLDGRLYLLNPPDTTDLTLHQGQWYVPFPPLPALLMLPWVALAGVGSLNTVVFAAVFGALNVTIIFLLLTSLAERGWSQLSTAGSLWLTLLFGLGSVHWYMATLGEVWFVAQICTVTFVALAVLLALQGRPAWLVGLALGLAMAARPNVVFTLPLLLGIVTMQLGSASQPWPWRRVLAWGLQAALPLALVALALLAYNQARFGNPLDFGYTSANVSSSLQEDLDTYGQFHPHYIRRNLHAMLLARPRWNAEHNFWHAQPDGMSLLLTTPALIYLALAHKRTPLVLGAWLSVGLLLIPLLLYYNTGWVQFGYRFSLDFMVPVMVLLATAMRSPLSWLARGLILLGVAVNLYGVLWWHTIL